MGNFEDFVSAANAIIWSNALIYLLLCRWHLFFCPDAFFPGKIDKGYG